MARFWGLRGRRLGTAVWTLAMFALMSFGYNQAVAGGVLGNDSFNRQFPQMDTLHTTGGKQEHNSTIQGTVVALYTLTGTFGALACTVFGDVIGRRRTIFLASGVQIVGEILMGTSFSFAQFIVSRIVVGLGTGGILATVSVWQAELAKAESRGEHVSAFGIFGGLGLALACWVDFGASYARSSSFAWRFPYMASIILSAVVMVFIFTLPESPRWLIKVGRIDEAREVMHLRYDTDDHNEVVEAEIQGILASFERAKSVSLAAMFTMGPERIFHRLVLAALTQMMLQMSGVNIVSYYAALIYEVNLGFSATVAQILAASSMFVIVLGSVVCSYTVDRFGRRALMLTSACGMTVCMSCLAGLTSRTEKAAINAAVFFLFFYYFTYTIGFLGIPFLYASEIAPVHLRAAICGVSTAVSWLFNFLVVEVTPIGFTHVHWRYFIPYAVLNLSWIPIVYYLLPETNGRSLEEIDEIFTRSNNIFDCVKVAKQLSKRRPRGFVDEETVIHADQKSPLGVAKRDVEEAEAEVEKSE
ncbi:Sugar transporter STL1 [Fonsecaea pedrosoi]|nr:Sugar transporter STL1 [Fonsecaea pedrosoi]